MESSSQSDITVLLEAAQRGESQAAADLYARVYEELHQIARAQRRRWKGNDTLNTTALIHEAFLKLAGDQGFDWQGRVHFFATASKAMRQVLVNYARMRNAAKRGGGVAELTLEENLLADDRAVEDVLSIHDALTELEANNERRGHIVECRVFGGLTNGEIAQSLGISLATVKREWRIASAWLYGRIQMPPGAGELPT